MDFGDFSGPYLGQQPPGEEAQLFMPGLISTYGRDGNLCFFDEGRALIFTSDERGTCLTRLLDGRWTSPENAPWAWPKGLMDYTLGGDGRTFYFGSRKHIRDGDSAVGANIWTAELTESGWTEPSPLPAPANTPDIDAFYPAASADGTVYYFARNVDGSPDADIYFSRCAAGTYLEAESLGWPINTNYDEIDFFVAPDESYIIFASERPGGYGLNDNYIAFRREDSSWTHAINMGGTVNSAGNEIRVSVSTDGKYIFFGSTRKTEVSKGQQFDSSTAYMYGDNDVYWVDACIIDDLRDELLTKESAASMVERALSDDGIQAAVETLAVLHATGRKEYFFSVYEFLAICERMLINGHVEEAERFRDALVSILPEDYRIRLGYAQLSAERGLIVRSIELLDGIASDFPEFDHEEIIHWLGVDLFFDGRLDDAMSVFNHSLESYPESARTYYFIATIHEKSGDKALALENCRKTLELKPGFTFASEMLKQLESN